MVVGKNVVSNLVRVTMMHRGLTWADLSRATGLKAETVAQVVSGAKASSLMMRRKIEVGLGMSIWSDSNEFASRLPMIRFYGTDPVTLQSAELRRLLEKHSPPGTRMPPRIFSRDNLIARVENLYAMLQTVRAQGVAA